MLLPKRIYPWKQLFLVVLTVCTVAGSGRRPVDAAQTVTVVVQLAPGVDPWQVSADHQATLLERIERFAIYRFQGANTNLPTQLAADPRVVAVETDQRLVAFQSQQQEFTDQEFTALQHYFSFGNGGKIGEFAMTTPTQKAWVVRNGRAFESSWVTWWQQATHLDRARLYASGANVTVAVLDTGADLDHPALVGHLLTGYDFVDNDGSPDDVAIGLDEDGDGQVDEGAGHGTQVSGIVAATAPGAKILPIRVLDSEGGGTLFAVVNGLAYAVANGAQVINLSLSSPHHSPLLQAAIDAALRQQVIVVAAASGSATGLDYPAAYGGVLAVGATRLGNDITEFTLAHAALVDLFAPGEMIYGPYYDGTYAWWSGSSMAAPMVAGIAALLLQTGACHASCVTTTLTKRVQAVSPAYPPLGSADAHQALLHYREADPQQGVCLLLSDQSVLSPTIGTVKKIATTHGVSAGWLLNGDLATTTGNPALRWNQFYAGDIVRLPGGYVTDGGWFTLPATPPWSLQSFFEGTLDQNKLRGISDLQPLANQDLARLIGRSCVAVAYAKELTFENNGAMDLRGNRYGSFAFTVLGVDLPKSDLSATADTPLYDLWVRVEAPRSFTTRLAPLPRAGATDTIQVNKATYQQGMLTLWATSNGAPQSLLTLSIGGMVGDGEPTLDPFLLEARLLYNANAKRYEFTFATATDLTARRLTVASNRGGSANHLVNYTPAGSNTAVDPLSFRAIPNVQQLFLPLVRQ